MKCAICNDEFNDGVQCGSCSRHLDFNCAHITEVGYRKLGADRRAAWKCSDCRRAGSPNPSAEPPSPEPTLELVLKEIRDIKSQLIKLPSLLEDIKAMKNELSEVKLACEFNCQKLDEFGTRLKVTEDKCQEVSKLQSTINSLVTEIANVKGEIQTNDQRSRLNNVEIKGVPYKKDENLFNIIEAISKQCKFVLPKSQLNYVSRVPIHQSKDKNIVINFVNRYIKEDFLVAARAAKLTACDIGFPNTSHRIFVNDHLGPQSKHLLTKVKELAKVKSFNYVWVKYGKIHVRKNDTSRVLIVNKEDDLNKMV